MDDRVVSLERTNIRYFDKDIIEEDVSFISIDVSFISLELVLPVAKDILGLKVKLSLLLSHNLKRAREKLARWNCKRQKSTY